MKEVDREVRGWTTQQGPFLRAADLKTATLPTISFIPNRWPNLPWTPLQQAPLQQDWWRRRRDHGSSTCSCWMRLVSLLVTLHASIASESALPPTSRPVDCSFAAAACCRRLSLAGSSLAGLSHANARSLWCAVAPPRSCWRESDACFACAVSGSNETATGCEGAGCCNALPETGDGNITSRTSLSSAGARALSP